MFKNITLVIISFKSENSIKLCLKNINKKFKIVLVENSKDEKIKKKFESFNSNIKVILNKNTGYGSAINLAVKYVTTKYFLVISPDVKLFNNTIKNLYINAIKLNNKFLILTPKYLDLNKNSKKQIIKNESIIEIKKIVGAIIFFHTKNFKRIKGFDENIFMYYEENDICKRAIKNKFKIYQINNSFVKHFGASSIDKKYKKENEINRNWHYMWSYYYYYKKHFGLIYAITISFPLIIRSLFRFILFYFINKNKYYMYKARFDGLINSLLNKKSWYRPNIRNN